MKKIATLSILALCLSAIASASFAAKPGYYLGAGVGAGRLGTANHNIVTGPDANDVSQSYRRGGVAGRVFGGYNFNDNFGLEAGLAKYTDAEYKASVPGVSAKTTYALSAVDVVAKGYLPISNGFNVYALGGVAYVHNKNKESVTVNGVKDSDSSTNNKFRPVYGVGASYDVPDTNVTTNVEVTRVQGMGNPSKSLSAIPNADMVSVNFVYNFGG